jgi:hypothetical protein
MIDRHMSSPDTEPEAGTPRTHRHLPLRIAEIREVQAPPAPTPLPGHLCEECLDAPAVLVVPAPEGGDLGLCAACQRAGGGGGAPGARGHSGTADALAASRATAGPLPAWWDRCVATAPARVCPCGSSRLRWGEDEAT